MAKPDVAKVIDDLARRYAEDSIGAIDHATNARAIALADIKLKSNLEERLNAGYALVRVSPLSGYGSSPDNFVIVFEFHKSSADQIVDLDTIYLRVTVNLPGHKVFGIEEIKDDLILDSNDVPFAIAVPSRAGEAVTILEALADTRQRERDFMRGLGLTDLVRSRDGDGWAQSDNNTFVDTSYPTTNSTEYDSSVNSGYTPDAVTDIKQDPGGDTGYKIDGSHDPDNDRGVTVPRDRPTLVIPRPGPDRPFPPPPRPGPDPVGPERSEH
jgi:hypothetical protein